MKAIQVIGYKDSGKSSLILELSMRLKKKGNTVCVLKHAHHLTITQKDNKMLQYAEKYLIASDEGAILYMPSFLQFLQAIAFVNADYLIIERFKEQNFIPRILCWKNDQEKKKLAVGTEIGYCGPGEWRSANKINALVKTIKKKSFLLPGINCGKCDLKTCHAMAMQILAEKKEPA